MPRNISPTGSATILMCIGLVATYLVLPDKQPTSIYLTAAIGVMLSVGGGLLLESGVGFPRSFIRTDVLMLVALYGLTLVEFFFPQPDVNLLISPKLATQGIEALFLGFAGLIIGRNFANRDRRQATSLATVQLRPRTTFILYVGTFCVSYFPMLLAVSFNPVELVHEMMGPRWSQSWSRGELGGLQDILGTVTGLLLYLIPAIAGCILADWRRYSVVQLVFVVFGVAFTLFYAFSGGTRSVFAVTLILALGSYIIFKHKIRWGRVAVLFALTAGMLYLSAYYMLQFRTIGLEAYLLGSREVQGYRTETLFIDRNLPVISLLTEVFPERLPYLGFEMASYVILRPVPRALWPDKPTKLSVDTADALGFRGLSVSSTFVGESYIMGGYPTVLIVGLLLGGLSGWWDRVGQNLRSNLGMLLYASGFFAAIGSMRSMIFTTTAMLPTFGLWLYMKSRKVRARPQMLRPPRGQPKI